MEYAQPRVCVSAKHSALQSRASLVSMYDEQLLAPLQELAIAIGKPCSKPCVPKTLRSLLGQWKQALLLGAVNLEALMIEANAAPCPPVLGCLPKLRYLELTLGQSEAWLSGFFADLSCCLSLESFKLTDGEMNILGGCHKLPDVDLSAMPKLRRIELEGWLPAATFNLPAGCELFAAAVCNINCPWDEHWRAMQRTLTVLNLWDIGLKEWPAGVERLSQLQYLQLLYDCEILEQDLAVLSAIPHVNLLIGGMASFTLTGGAWQSLQVHGGGNLRITFTDANAFVRGTERFLFCSTGPVEMSQPMCASIREACSRQLKSCYQCTFKEPHYGRQVVRLSNCADAMRLEPSSDGNAVPSGGLHDGYAGTPEDSPLWEGLSAKSLVTQDDVWPKWEPHKWVFGS